MHFLQRHGAKQAFLHATKATYLHGQNFGVPPPKFPGMAVTALVHIGQIACLSSPRVHVVPTCTRFFYPEKISRNPEKSFAESQLDACPCLRHPVIAEFATSLRYQKAGYHG